jgi:hypothetical protein
MYLYLKNIWHIFNKFLGVPYSVLNTPPHCLADSDGTPESGESPVESSGFSGVKTTATG